MTTTPPPLLQSPSCQANPPIRQKRRKSTVLITITSVLAVCLIAFIGFRLVSIASSAIKTLQNRPADRIHLIEAPEYETLLGEGLAGSGFHFKAGDHVYLCTSLHQFDGRRPDVMSSFEFDAPIKVVGVAHKQQDIQVLLFQSDDLRKIAPLPYSKDAIVDIGLPIYIYADSGTVKGHVSSINRSDGTIKIRMTESFAAGGQSGGPIVSGETGTVIGVLIKANSPESATRVEAELLQFPESLEKAAEQAGTGQPATRPESKSEGGDQPQPEAEGRSR